MKYKISQYAKLNNVTIRTVWNWIYTDKIKVEKTKTGRNLIVIDETTIIQKVVVYVRVSSSENKTNIETQKNRLFDYCAAKGYAVEKIYIEIGSGLNDKRPILESILVDKTITHIVVENKDRLTRFGLNYIEKLLELDNRKIEVINTNDNIKDDIMNDFIYIITYFVDKLYGQNITKRKTEKIIELLNENK